MNTISYSLAPQDWAVCFNNECPKAGSCLRHAVGRLVPTKVTCHNCVLPSAMRSDGCNHFVSNEPIRVARGMRSLLVPFNEYESKLIRRRLFEIFGSRAMYYNYYNGRYAIKPAQQELVAGVLREFGYSGKPHFDRVEEQYQFDA